MHIHGKMNPEKLKGKSIVLCFFNLSGFLYHSGKCLFPENGVPVSVSTTFPPRLSALEAILQPNDSQDNLVDAGGWAGLLDSSLMAKFYFLYQRDVTLYRDVTQHFEDCFNMPLNQLRSTRHHPPTSQICQVAEAQRTPAAVVDAFCKAYW